MPIPLGTLLNKIALKFGADTTLPEFASLLAIQSEVPDNIVAAFEKDLITEDAAMSSLKIKNAFTATALNGVDQRITALLDEFQFSPEDRGQILGISSTYERVPAVVRKLAEKITDLESKKAGASTGDKAALQKQINDLQAEIGQKLQAKDQEFLGKEKQFEERMKALILANKVGTKKLDTSKFSAEAMQKLALQYLNEELQAKGLVVLNENDTLKIKQAKDTSLDYFENNRAVTIDSFLDEVLANNKLLAVTEQTPAPVITGPRQQYPPPTGQQQQPQPLTGMKTSLDQALADYARGSGG